MAASGHRGGRIAQIPPLGGSVSAAGRAGGIVLGGVRQDGQLVQNIHGVISGSGGSSAGQGARWRR